MSAKEFGSCLGVCWLQKQNLFSSKSKNARKRVDFWTKELGAVYGGTLNTGEVCVMCEKFFVARI